MKTTIKAMRYSGLPVNMASMTAYQTEWTAAFDDLKHKHGNDMLSLQADLAKVEEDLRTKYQVTEIWELLKTKKAIKTKMLEYGCPILIAQSSENPDELVYVLMDSGLS